MMRGQHGTAGVDWEQVTKIGYTLPPPLMTFIIRSPALAALTKQIGEEVQQFCAAIALGLGAMIGWKRIVVTVGEKIGKTHLTYGQGAANGPGTLRNIALAWALTLRAAMILSGVLYAVFRSSF